MPPDHSAIPPEVMKQIEERTNKITGHAMSCDRGTGLTGLIGGCLDLLLQITDQIQSLEASDDGTKAHEVMLEEARQRLAEFREQALKYARQRPHRCVEL
jgi:hypothetical protein